MFIFLQNFGMVNLENKLSCRLFVLFFRPNSFLKYIRSWFLTGAQTSSAGQPLFLTDSLPQ